MWTGNSKWKIKYFLPGNQSSDPVLDTEIPEGRFEMSIYWICVQGAKKCMYKKVLANIGTAIPTEALPFVATNLISRCTN